ncbi:Multidrug resistance protein fnx1 [Grifola frondosa]|uniref:MFS-type drug efflux transporter P55 n=1 Tax=Grifola frondosa TaxID=5627 RepID=A0A1C7M431_GRIFR|nr:Multidrug resistance protein fnx1 [Grifola frondosa]
MLEKADIPRFAFSPPRGLCVLMSILGRRDVDEEGRAFMPVETIADSKAEQPTDKFLGVAVAVSFLVFVSGLDVTVVAAVAPIVAEDLGDAAITGLGIGGISVMVSIILSETVPLKSRALWHSTGKLVGGVAMALGGPLGGFLTDTYHWRAAFLLQVPFALMCIVVTLYAVRSPSSLTEPRSAPLKALDIWGCILLPMTLIPLLLGFSTFSNIILAGDETPHARVPIYILAATSVVAGAAFCHAESTATNPIISVRLFRSPNVGSICLLQFFAALVHYAILYTAPVFAIIISHASTTSAGVSIMPVSLAACIGTLAAGVHISRTGKYKTLLLVGAMSVTVGPLAFVYVLNIQTGTPAYTIARILSSFPATFGFQLTNSVSVVALLALCSATDIAGLTSHASLFKSLGGVIGTALSAILIQMFLSWELSRNIFGDNRQYIDAIKASARDLSGLPTEIQAVGQSIWQHSFVYMFGTLAAISALNIGLAIWGVSEIDIGNAGGL